MYSGILSNIRTVLFEKRNQESRLAGGPFWLALILTPEDESVTIPLERTFSDSSPLENYDSISGCWYGGICPHSIFLVGDLVARTFHLSIRGLDALSCVS